MIKFLKAYLIFGIIMLYGAMMRSKYGIFTYFELKESRDKLSKSVSDLKKHNENLNLEIQKIKDSPAYAKKLLKDKYHLTEEGEQVFFFGD